MEHLHKIYDTDLHFVIDPITRQITSESGKVVLMQNDHNSERFTFEVPRYIEGHDMSVSNYVQIHYINIDGSNKGNQNPDVYEADDLQVSPDSDDVVIFSWLLSHNATTLAGSLAFVVRFVCYAEDEIVYQWFSDTFDKIKVNKIIFNGDNVIPDEYDIDVLEKWRRDVIDAFTKSDAYQTTLECRDQSVVAIQEVTTIVENAKQEVVTEFEESDVYRSTLDCRDQSLAAIQETRDILDGVRHIASETEFHFNLETGHLEYDSPNYDWQINHATGNLEWEVKNNE